MMQSVAAAALALPGQMADENKISKDKGPRKQVTFSDITMANSNAAAASPSEDIQLQHTVQQIVEVPVRSENNSEKDPPQHGKILHSNLRLLDERRNTVWMKMDGVIEESDKLYKSRIASVKSIEKQLIASIQETAKNTIAALDKNKEILLETIGQKLSEFDSLNRVCEEDIKTLNLMQNRLKETLDRVGFNL